MRNLSEAKVGQIFIAPQRGEPMQRANGVLAIAGQGLAGDRYTKGEGFWQNTPKVREAIRHVTLISQQAIDDASLELGVSFSGQMSRRNIVVDGDVDLLGLVGYEFTIGDVLMRGAEECPPCKRPSELSGVEGFATAFREHGRGGLRAEILSSGEIYEGDKVSVR